MKALYTIEGARKFFNDRYPDNPGYAEQLARGYVFLIRIGAEISWEPDYDPDLGDHEYWCGDHGKEHDHEVYGCVVKVGGLHHDSLWCIIDPDDDYKREVEAQLGAQILGYCAPWEGNSG